jgi:hypothetical protein
MKFDENELLEKMVEHNAIMRDIEITQPHTLSFQQNETSMETLSLLPRTLLCYVIVVIFFNNL